MRNTKSLDARIAKPPIIKDERLADAQRYAQEADQNSQEIEAGQDQVDAMILSFKIKRLFQIEKNVRGDQANQRQQRQRMDHRRSPVVSEQVHGKQSPRARPEKQAGDSRKFPELHSRDEQVQLHSSDDHGVMRIRRFYESVESVIMHLTQHV